MFCNISEAASTQVGVTQIVAILDFSSGLLLYIAIINEPLLTPTKMIDLFLTA